MYNMHEDLAPFVSVLGVFVLGLSVMGNAFFEVTERRHYLSVVALTEAHCLADEATTRLMTNTSGKLTQVVLNVMSNANKFGSPQHTPASRHRISGTKGSSNSNSSGSGEKRKLFGQFFGQTRSL
mmetsp:Transcript_68827/g.161955  ORF Transcript_68827/g.161955 Transcript_68827/m.161955 type:complete len:125 (-) Transcript_68827:28-402(-)